MGFLSAIFMIGFAIIMLYLVDYVFLIGGWIHSTIAYYYYNTTGQKLDIGFPLDPMIIVIFFNILFIGLLILGFIELIYAIKGKTVLG